jgi:hypothetical protein
MKSERISAGEFARRAGCDARQVRRALARGALVRGSDGLIDAALIGSAWRKPNRCSLAKEAQGTALGIASGAHACDSETLNAAARRIAEASPELLELRDAIRRKENYLALLRELEYEQKAGRLIELKLAEAVVFETFREVRNVWLNWPQKVAPFIAAELDVDIDRVATLLSQHVYEQLLEISEPQPDFQSS